MKFRMFIALAAALFSFTGCDVEPEFDELVDAEVDDEVAPRLINQGGDCPPGYEWDGSWCVVTGNPGPIPPYGGGSCIAPACKTGCGTMRSRCIDFCGDNSACIDGCWSQFDQCIDSCC